MGKQIGTLRTDCFIQDDCFIRCCLIQGDCICGTASLKMTNINQLQQRCTYKAACPRHNLKHTQSSLMLSHVPFLQHTKLTVRLKRTRTNNKHYIFLNPLTPINDQDRISPYNINSISRRKVMRIKKNINLGIFS